MIGFEIADALLVLLADTRFNIDWILVWKICLVVALLAFSVLSLVVIVGGASDVWKLLAALARDDSKHPPK